MTNKNSINFWLDIISLFIMIGLVLTGGLMYFVLPSGTGHTHTLFGYNRHDFGDFHLYLAVASVVLLFAHVFLHWNWLCRMTARTLGDKSDSRLSRQAWGVVLLCGILLFLFGSMWWASSKVEQNARDMVRPYRGRIANQSGSEAFRGPEASVNGAKGTPREKTEVHDKPLEDCPQGMAINGRTTLFQAARVCGVSVEQLRQVLRLPADVDASEHLGRLKRWHGLAIHDIRRFACR